MILMLALPVAAQAWNGNGEIYGKSSKGYTASEYNNSYYAYASTEVDEVAAAKGRADEAYAKAEKALREINGLKAKDKMANARLDDQEETLTGLKNQVKYNAKANNHNNKYFKDRLDKVDGEVKKIVDKIDDAIGSAWAFMWIFVVLVVLCIIVSFLTRGKSK